MAADVIDPGDAAGVMAWAAERFSGAIRLSTSFSIEDQVMTHVIASNRLPISIFTLDTGRLFGETYDVHSETLLRYGLTIDTYFPNDVRVGEMVSGKGPNGFYESVENRLLCCHIRKVLPLRDALKGVKCWLTGVRQAHSEDRYLADMIEWDPVHHLVKIQPLFRWDDDQIWRFINDHYVPVNVLSKRGFSSIGCAPCTRAVQPGEPYRAGRWYWENAIKKECGLHTRQPEEAV